MVPLGRRHLAEGTDLSALLHEWRDGSVRRQSFAWRAWTIHGLGGMDDADPNVGSIPGNGSGLRGQAQLKPTPRSAQQNLPLSAAEERLGVEAAQINRGSSSVCEPARISTSRRNACRASSICSGRAGEIPGRSNAGGKHQPGNLAGSTWQRASQGRHWSVLRRIAGPRWLDPALEEAVTNLLVRQKHVLVGKAYSPDSLITEPMGGPVIAERIARVFPETSGSVSWPEILESRHL